jgi:5-oxoprolinase (ATP-hydrolysing)
MKQCKHFHRKRDTRYTFTNHVNRHGALRLVSVEQGYDPRDFSLVAFGGAGPLHANAVGKLLGAYPIIIPPSPGVLCAWGDATTLLRHEVTMTLIRVLATSKVEDILEAFENLSTKAREVMRTDQGVPDSMQVIFCNGNSERTANVLLGLKIRSGPPI